MTLYKNENEKKMSDQVNHNNEQRHHQTPPDIAPRAMLHQNLSYLSLPF
jgi:hypothetical protein